MADIPLPKRIRIMVTVAPAPQNTSSRSARMNLMIQLPPMRPAMNMLIPPNDSHSEASRAVMPACSVT